MIEMKIAGIALDAATRSPIVLLRDASERRALPIYISQDQARSIISAIEQQTPPRPMTHDLMVSILEAWELRLDRVIVHALEENTFFAVLKMVNADGKVKKEIDARPSDAIALALRTDASIWVMEEVVADASIPVDQDADEAERQAFREFLNNLSPQELIKRAGQEFSDS
ncbi:MAG: bifunctional nuclease family protein [Sodalinema sp.]|uniref:bifunctional nuclease family protein n=1 Tax=Sodalinema sp. TaxID=3080550 RepID=UPI0011FC0928|nr:MAG: bifunctional nuclease family protein [Phormidium sp. SL48-SHIP]